jgi:hypothetical protein
LFPLFKAFFVFGFFLSFLVATTLPSLELDVSEFLVSIGGCENVCVRCQAFEAFLLAGGRTGAGAFVFVVGKLLRCRKDQFLTASGRIINFSLIFFPDTNIIPGETGEECHPKEHARVSTSILYCNGVFFSRSFLILMPRILDLCASICCSIWKHPSTWICAVA